MIEIDNTLISDEIISQKFVCDLNACKGECCVAGDSGAPLDKDELNLIAKAYPAAKPYMQAEGIEAVEKFGTHIIDSDGDDVTPLVGGNRECAYVYFEKGIAKCAIEKAYLAGETSFKKPISCHLYPIRITRTMAYDLLNYNRWHLCAPACSCGKKLNVLVYKFLKEPLIRRYGKEWYEALCEAAKLVENKL